MEILDALEHHRSGRLAEAVQIYQKILQTDSGNGDALHLMGNAAYQMGDMDLSISLVSKAIALFPNNASYSVSLALAYRAKGLFERAIACYTHALELDPNFASAYFGIGVTLQAQGMLEDAAISFGKALELNPDFVEARYNLANIEKTFGQYDKAIGNYRMAVAAKPDFADAYHNMGSALYALGKLDDALGSYEQALWRNLPETHNNIGNIHFDRGELNLALACYQQAIAAKPDYAVAYNNLGNTQRSLGRLQDSAVAFGGAIRIKPDYAIAHLNLGHLLLDADLIGEAARYYEHAVVIAPEMAEAHLSLGIAKVQQNDLLAACVCFEQAIACRPDYRDAIYNLGVVNGRLSRWSEAERCYRWVLNMDPRHVDAHINLSAILLEDGRMAEAKKHVDLAYCQKNLFEKYSPSANKTILILFDAGKGNLNLNHLFNEKDNNIIDWIIEYSTADQAGQLPDHDLVFNAMGDPGLTGDVVGPVGRFLEMCAKPLLNHPHKVARTARDKLPGLLEGIDTLIVPSVRRFVQSGEWDTSFADQLPLLIRPVHTHGGVGLELATTAAELARIRELQYGPVYVSRYVDYRSADSWFRKYRMIFIDRVPYPYHVAISRNWLVHYHTAEMESHPWKLVEEKAFLEDPEAVLGLVGMQAIRLIGARMDLDYAGLDFSIMPDGRILVFEANPTMLVHPENPSGTLGHKNVHVRRILDAFEALLTRSIGSR